MDKKNKTFTFLHPEHLAPIRNLDLRARLIVEGTIAGLHQSPYHGFSTEFLEYRPYLPGESTRRIDWRKFAKTDRTVVRLFEDETNLYANILIDKSASMKFCSTKIMDKYDYARTLAASLALILVRQRDAVGLSAFDETTSCSLAPHSTNIQLKTIMANLTAWKLRRHAVRGRIIPFAQTLKKRGLCIVISDLFDEPEEIIRGLRHLRFKKQDIIVLRIADPMEQNFKMRPRSRYTILKRVKSSRLTRHCRASSIRELPSITPIKKRACQELAIHCGAILTSQPFHKALLRVLG